MITIYKSLFEINTPFYREILFILTRIKQGKSKAIIEAVRAEADKEKRNKIKEQLPAICFSGYFKTRNASGITKHSGFMCLDFDNYTSTKELNDQKGKLIMDPYTYSVFTSPSGDGLKLIVKVPPSVENHKGYFEALQTYYNCPHFDISGKDVSRVCFESYDPNIFINENSTLWEKTDADQGYKYSERPPTIIIAEEAVIIERLVKWWEKRFGIAEGSRNANVYKLAAAFNDYGVEHGNATHYMQRFESKDFTMKEIEKTVRSAYAKKENYGTKYFEDKTKVEHVKNQLKSGKSVVEISMKTNVDAGIVEGIAGENSTDIFWHIGKKVSIDNYRYKKWLESNGFFKYYPEGSEGFIFIRIENNLIDNTNEVKLKDFVLKYLLEKKEFEVYQYMTNQARFFKEDILNTLDSIVIRFKSDSRWASYLYFRNCAVEVMKDKINQIDYLDLDGFVWKKHIIDFDYKPSATDSDYKKFIYNVAGKNDDKEKSIRSTIGYLLSSHKNLSNNVAVILNDEMISENPNGGTGKGIFVDAIGRMKRTAVIDGKTLDFKKSFPYQTVSADTQIVVFDDVPKNFPFENLFSVITEGITLEKKNKDAIRIPVAKSPKILISTNYAIGGDGNSFDRRKWEVEFAQHYKRSHRPVDDFGKMLFEEWDFKEFNNFYSYMIECLQIFIREGLIKSEFNNLKVRQFIAKTSYDFYDWTKDNTLDTGVAITKADKFDEFVTAFPDFKKFLSRKRFSQWLEKYGEYMGYETTSGNSIGQRWIQYKTEGSPVTAMPF